MSSYKYSMHDYHAIKSADINIDGITVLSGINGCGKSTLSRWLFYIVNGVEEFDKLLFADYINKLIELISRMRIACFEFIRIRRVNGSQNEKDPLSKLNDIEEKLQSLVYAGKQIEYAQELFLQAVDLTKTFLSDTWDDKISDARKSRILGYLNIDADNTNICSVIELFDEKFNRFCRSLTRALLDDMERRSAKKFFTLVRYNYDVYGDPPVSANLEEDGVNVIESEHVSSLFNLHKAIYVDTPMSVDARKTDNVFWNSLREMLVSNRRNHDLSDDEKSLLLEIRKLLGGEAVLEKDSFFEEKELHYVSDDKTINISINEVATGFKTFSYLQRLLENGYLNNETLLLIDEPEAHLHPQWIVEFARLLVMLNKKTGLKILIASHNPDMVAALHDIADKEGVLDKTNFYVAQQVNLHQFEYRHLGHEIGEIFESFNIALDYINRYGAEGL